MSANARPFAAPADFPNNHVVSITQFDRGSVECVRHGRRSRFFSPVQFCARIRTKNTDDGGRLTPRQPPSHTRRFLCAIADIMRSIVERKGGCDVLKHKVRTSRARGWGEPRRRPNQGHDVKRPDGRGLGSPSTTCHGEWPVNGE